WSVQRHRLGVRDACLWVAMGGRSRRNARGPSKVARAGNGTYQPRVRRRMASRPRSRVWVVVVLALVGSLMWWRHHHAAEPPATSTVVQALPGSPSSGSAAPAMTGELARLTVSVIDER